MPKMPVAPTMLVAVALLCAGATLAGCGSGGSGDQASSTVAATPVTAPGPFFGQCGSVTDDEVTTAFGLPPFTSVTRNSVGCEWELGGSGSPSVSFSWYRGSPIGRERAGSDLIGRPATDIDVQGHPGFMASSKNAAGQDYLCEIGVQFGGDFIHWSVMYGYFPPAADPCRVGRDLVELTVKRAQ